MVQLKPFEEADFERLISWADSMEALIQFAGPVFQFPLTPEQLSTHLSEKKNHVFKVIHPEKEEVIGHAEIHHSDEHHARLCRILIGNKNYRGQGLGEALVRQLADHAFNELHVSTIDLNVYDWNTSAIACFETVGFTLNPEQSYTIDVNGMMWTAVNMVLRKEP